jgi:hypothetical protein
MTRQIVMEFASRIMKQYPSLYNDIIDFIRLAIDEIDEGASPTHEWELAYGSIKELIEEHENKQQNESID